MPGSSGSPIFFDRIFSTNSSSKRFRTGSTTMKRLAAMQLWPLLMRREVTHVSAASSRSASSSTT